MGYIKRWISDEFDDDLSPKEASIVLDRYMSIDRRKYTVGIITPFRANADRICQGLMRLGIDNAYEVCGTVHSFQGDQKDIILLSSSINKSTRKGTYSWLSRNSELINVASTRAKKSLILFSDDEKLNELHEMISKENTDDWYDFAQYIKSNGEITSFQGYKDPRIEKICEENENTDAVLAKTIKNVTDRMKSKNEIELKEMVSPRDVFSSSDGAEVGKIWGKVLRTVVYENNKPVIVIEQGDIGDKEGAIALSSLEKKKSFCEAEGIAFLQIPNSYARRYNLIYNQIEKLIK